MVIGFIVYVTSRGTLPVYLSVLFGTAAPASDPASNTLNAINAGASALGAAAGAITGANKVGPAISGLFGFQ